MTVPRCLSMKTIGLSISMSVPGAPETLRTTVPSSALLEDLALRRLQLAAALLDVAVDDDVPLRAEDADRPDVGVRFPDLEDHVVEAEQVLGAHEEARRRGDAPAQGFRRPDDLVGDVGVHDADGDEVGEERRGGEEKKDEQGGLGPDVPEGERKLCVRGYITPSLYYDFTEMAVQGGMRY